MRGHDEWRARRERGQQPGRDEEVRVDHVRPEAAGRADRVPAEAQVARLPAASAVEDRPLQLVPAARQLLLESLDEHAEVGVFGPRVHLRDEEDPHYARWAS